MFLWARPKPMPTEQQTLTWNAAGIAPGAYEILVLDADDLTDPLAKGNSRHLKQHCS